MEGDADRSQSPSLFLHERAGAFGLMQVLTARIYFFSQKRSLMNPAHRYATQKVPANQASNISPGVFHQEESFTSAARCAKFLW
jgi:hypothetical protein